MDKFTIRVGRAKLAADTRRRVRKGLKKLSAAKAETVLKAVYDNQDDTAQRAAALDLRLTVLADRLRQGLSSRNEGIAKQEAADSEAADN
ncbi:MAG: hypothetical protein MK180_06950 [Rhodobacteraceae bacterium]|nr:hypothetical protein [Paracoccaceae bacterium]